jgi:hypothetical protein
VIPYFLTAAMMASVMLDGATPRPVESVYDHLEEWRSGRRGLPARQPHIMEERGDVAVARVHLVPEGGQLPAVEPARDERGLA